MSKLQLTDEECVPWDDAYWRAYANGDAMPYIAADTFIRCRRARRLAAEQSPAPSTAGDRDAEVSMLNMMVSEFERGYSDLTSNMRPLREASDEISEWLDGIPLDGDDSQMRERFRRALAIATEYLDAAEQSPAPLQVGAGGGGGGVLPCGHDAKSLVSLAGREGCDAYCVECGVTEQSPAPSQDAQEVPCSIEFLPGPGAPPVQCLKASGHDGKHSFEKREEPAHECVENLACDFAAARREAGELKAQIVHVYNSGYHAGHHDTVEGQYVDIRGSDMDTYHAEEVDELLRALLAPPPERAGESQ